jgi:hypothetical protein
MMTTDVMHAVDLNDAELVSKTLAGNRDAFRQIVERYQTLIASLAYCATGNVILGFIFYNYGFGLFGRLGSLPAALIGVIIGVGLLGFSRTWLKHYRFGPAEWLWRSLTYGAWQPMRRTQPPYAETAALAPGRSARRI